MKYLILGMPRCRTAWLSVFLSSARGTYSHEAYGEYECAGIRDYIALVDREGFIGDSTTMGYILSKAYPETMDLLLKDPSITIMTVVRDVEDCLTSCLSVIKDSPEDFTPYLRRDLRAKREWLDSLEPVRGQRMIRFDYSHFQSRESLKLCYREMTGLNLCRDSYIDKMQKLNIQRHSVLDAYDTEFVKTLNELAGIC